VVNHFFCSGIRWHKNDSFARYRNVGRANGLLASFDKNQCNDKSFAGLSKA
jgi:hypothetical protein